MAMDDTGSEVGGTRDPNEAQESRFWRWVRAGLNAKHWDMQTLAEVAGIAQSTLTALRQNPARRPTPETCRKIARAFGAPETLALEIAGHLRPGEVRTAVHQATGQRLLIHTDPESGETGTLPLPAQLLPVDAVELAKLAVQLVPDQRLSEEDKWRILSLIDALAQAQVLTQGVPPQVPIPPALPQPEQQSQQQHGSDSGSGSNCPQSRSAAK